jgi:hypothetical protein
MVDEASTWETGKEPAYDYHVNFTQCPGRYPGDGAATATTRVSSCEHRQRFRTRAWPPRPLRDWVGHRSDRRDQIQPDEQRPTSRSPPDLQDTTTHTPYNAPTLTSTRRHGAPEWRISAEEPDVKSCILRQPPEHPPRGNRRLRRRRMQTRTTSVGQLAPPPQTCTSSVSTGLLPAVD